MDTLNISINWTLSISLGQHYLHLALLFTKENIIILGIRSKWQQIGSIQELQSSILMCDCVGLSPINEWSITQQNHFVWQPNKGCLWISSWLKHALCWVAADWQVGAPEYQVLHNSPLSFWARILVFSYIVSIDIVLQHISCVINDIQGSHLGQ